MREKSRGIAGGTTLDYFDVFCCQAKILQLTAVGFHQIEVEFLGRITMSRRALVQEEQRISDMQGIGVEAFVKQFARIGKLGFEFGTHLMSHNVAATANAWPDDGTQLAGSAAEMAAHLSDTLLDDARHGSAPTGMEGPDGPALTIHHENRNAVGGLHRQQQPGCQ